MPSNGGNYHKPPAPGTYFQPHNSAFQYNDGQSRSSHVGMSSSLMQAPSNGNLNNGALHLLPSNGGNYHKPPAPGTYFQTWNVQYNGSSSNSHVGTSSSWMLAPSNGNFNNGAVHDLAIRSPTESSNAFTRYPYMHTSGNPPRAVYPDQFTSDNNFSNNALVEFLNMGVRGNGMNYLGGYEAQGSSNNLQFSGASHNYSSEGRLGY
jgi:hypothetical protein